jgi:signal transduction histidine kinase
MSRAVEADVSRQFRVLLVDDNELDRLLVGRLLADSQTCRFDVVPAADGRHALEAVNATAFDLVFLDFYLGDEDCTDLIQAIRQAEFRVPIVVLTGSTDPGVVEACLAAGADDYVNKAAMSSHLLDHTVRYAVKRRADELQLRSLAAELTRRNTALEEAISRKVLAEEELERAYARLEQTRRMETVGQLASGVAHEFNNVLATINGYGELMSSIEFPPEQIRAYAEEITAAGRRGAELTQKLSSFAKNTVTRGRRLDLGAVLRDRVRDAGEREDRRIDFHLDLPPGPVLTAADPGQVTLVVEAVLLNACEAILSEGEVRISARAETLRDGECQRISDWIRPGRYWRVDIADTGVGMSQYVCDRVFDPFFTTKDVGEGSGLGMAAVYGAMKSHQGAVQIHSAPGEGTTVSLWFAVFNQPAAVEVEEEEEPTAGAHRRILVVDDDASVRGVSETMLRSLGFDVVGVDSGAAAIDTFTDEPLGFDLVLLDLLMPGSMDGAATFRALRELDPEVCVVLCSGFLESLGDPELREGASGLLRKPFDLEGLRVCVAHALGEDVLSAS